MISPPTIQSHPHRRPKMHSHQNQLLDLSFFSAFLRNRSIYRSCLLTLTLLLLSLIYFSLHLYQSSPQAGGLGSTLTDTYLYPLVQPSSSKVVDPDQDWKTQLLALPILRHTSHNASDPIHLQKPLPDAHTPWNPSASNGAALLARLGTSPRSKPPPHSVWPPASALPLRDRTSIDHQDLSRFEEAIASPLPSMPDSKSLPPVQWPGFKSRDGTWETSEQEHIRSLRKAWVRRTFQHVWEDYKTHAWAHDEISPISGKVRNTLQNHHQIKMIVYFPLSFFFFFHVDFRNFESFINSKAGLSD